MAKKKKPVPARHKKAKSAQSLGVPVKSAAAESASARQGEKKPKAFFLAAIGISVIIALALILFSFSGRGEESRVAQQKQQPENPSQQTSAPAQAKITSATFDSAYFLGNGSADIILVEYGDFECPYSAAALAAISETRASHPEIKFAYRHYPLSVHPGAEKAAEAAECAGAQGKFWEMHDRLYASSGTQSAASLKSHAAGLSLDTALFSFCLDTGKMSTVVASQQAEGQALGMRGTPSFLVFSRKGAGNAALAKRVQNEAAVLFSRYSAYNLPVSAVEVQGAGVGIIFAGALPYSDFEEVLGAFR